MNYLVEVMLFVIIALLCGILAFMRMYWLSLKDIKLEGKPVIIYREHPKPRPGGLTKKPVLVHSDQSMWEKEQNGHSKPTTEIV
jgi:hypothetical protein